MRLIVETLPLDKEDCVFSSPLYGTPERFCILARNKCNLHEGFNETDCNGLKCIAEQTEPIRTTTASGVWEYRSGRWEYIGEAQQTEPQTDWNPTEDCNTCKYSEEDWTNPKCDGCCKANSHYEPKDKPQTDCLTCRYNSDEWDSPKCDNCVVSTGGTPSNYEPQTDDERVIEMALNDCRERHNGCDNCDTDCAWK